MCPGVFYLWGACFASPVSVVAIEIPEDDGVLTEVNGEFLFMIPASHGTLVVRIYFDGGVRAFDLAARSWHSTSCVGLQGRGLGFLLVGGLPKHKCRLGDLPGMCELSLHGLRVPLGVSQVGVQCSIPRHVGAFRQLFVGFP